MASSSIATVAGGAAGDSQTEAYLRQRGLDPSLAASHGVTSGRGVINFNYILNGETVNEKHRSLSDGKWWQRGGGEKTFWNIDSISAEGCADFPVVITEGEFDSLAALQAGYPRTISCPDGAPAKSIPLNSGGRKYEYVESALDLLANETDIVLAVDNDGPGHALLEDLSLRLGKARCRWVTYPEDCKDLNDVLLRHGSGAVSEAIDNARECQIDGLYRMSDLPPVPEREVYDVPGFEALFRLRMGDFSVVTGIPGHGKSTWANHFICSLVEKHNFPVCFASFEQSPQMDHRRNLRQWYCRKKIDYIEPDDLSRADEWIDNQFVFIFPSYEDDVDLDYVVDKMASAVIRHGVKVIVLDPWNHIQHHKPDGDTLTVYTGNAIRRLKRFADKYSVHVMVIAHPVKMRQFEDGTFEMPSLYSISDSSHWYNAPDLGAVIYKLEGDAAMFRTLKSRYHDQIGKPGQARMLFSNHTGRFHVQGSEADTFLD